MSDYISKSALIHALENKYTSIPFIEKNYEMFYHNSGYNCAIGTAKLLVDKFPTVDEKEIIRKPMERIVEQLQEIAFTEITKEYGRMEIVSLEDALNVV